MRHFDQPCYKIAPDRMDGYILQFYFKGHGAAGDGRLLWRKKLAMSICPACRKGAVETCERDGITNAVRASVGRSAVACPIQTCLERSVDFDINRNALRH
jgi:hypothetical protein